MPMRKLFQLVILIFLCSMANEATSQVRPLVIYDGAVTELRTPSPFTQSKDLWVTLAELTSATGFVVKPQGVCRGELCFPLPKQRKGDRKSTRLNSSHLVISYAVFCLKKKKTKFKALTARFRKYRLA